MDDHDLFRTGLRAEAASGEAALRWAAELKPDVVVMDLNMPGISGIEATLLWRARRKDETSLRRYVAPATRRWRSRRDLRLQPSSREDYSNVQWPRSHVRN